VQESIAEVRERSPRRGEIDGEGIVADPLAELRPPAPEPGLDPGLPVEVPPVARPSDPPPLRDVSQDVPGTPAGDNPEEIRRRIQETRSRLQRARLDTPEPKDVPEEGRDVWVRTMHLVEARTGILDGIPVKRWWHMRMRPIPFIPAIVEISSKEAARIGLRRYRSLGAPRASRCAEVRRS
jgi:hypothetical protein